jgi:hypothetical protein
MFLLLLGTCVPKSLGANKGAKGQGKEKTKLFPIFFAKEKVIFSSEHLLGPTFSSCWETVI